MTNDEIVKALNEAAVYITEDDEATIEGLLADGSEEALFTAGDAIEHAVQSLLRARGYQHEVRINFEVLPFDTYAFDDVFIIAVRCPDGKCVTLHQDTFGNWRLGRAYPLKDVDDAVTIVKDLVEAALNAK